MAARAVRLGTPRRKDEGLRIGTVRRLPELLQERGAEIE